jgi:hypothetical protein
MARIQKVPTAPFSPFYGCTIMIIAILIFGGIVTWSVYSLLTQDKQIALFTQDDPVTLAPAKLADEQQAGLLQRLTAFGQAIQAGQAASLRLSLPELNALPELAPKTDYGSYAGMVLLEKTDPAKNTLSGKICLPLNRLKFWEGKKRYLIGDATFLAEVNTEGVDAKVVDVKVPGKEVPEGFVSGMEIWTLLAPYRKSEPLGAILKGIQKVEVTTDGLILSSAKKQG